MTLSESRNIAVRSTLPTVSAGRKYNLRVAVLQAQAALRHRDVVGQVLLGQSKATAADRRKLVEEEIYWLLNVQEQFLRQSRASDEVQKFKN